MAYNNVVSLLTLPNPARMAKFTMTAAFFTLLASAQTPPYALFQYATISGSGNTITASHVPVVISTGTIYKDLTIQFSVDSSGNLTLTPGYPELTASPSIPPAFTAGRYVGPSTFGSGAAFIAVSGPGYTAGGATEWSLSSAAANSCTTPTNATWYDGPIASSPIAARLSKAGITSTAWSYGIGSGTSYCSPTVGGAWNGNSLLGFSQVGNTITIVSFTVSGVDSSLPVDSITYTLAP